MKNGKRKSEPENTKNSPRKRSLAGTLTLTATLAALGTSLGVDVNTLFAAGPMSEGATQTKLEAPLPAAVQGKMKGTPAGVQIKLKGMPPAARQLKIDGNAATGQGTLKQGVPPSVNMKQNVVPAVQIKLKGSDSGPLGTMVPGTAIPAR